MSIWHVEPRLKRLNDMCANTLVHNLGIEFTAFDEQSLTGTMPVDTRTLQPFGVVHGGAYVALAETLGSAAAALCVPPTHIALGLEINANHVRSASEGIITGTARPLHIGNSTQVWEIRMENEQGQLCSIARHTVAVKPKRG